MSKTKATLHFVVLLIIGAVGSALIVRWLRLHGGNGLTLFLSVPLGILLIVAPEFWFSMQQRGQARRQWQKRFLPQIGTVLLALWALIEVDGLRVWLAGMWIAYWFAVVIWDFLLDSCSLKNEYLNWVKQAKLL